MTETGRLLVQWRNDVTAAIHRIGILTHTDRYGFRYLPKVVGIEGFRPLPPFPNVAQGYESATLFPFFAARVLDPKRPDYDSFLRALGLQRTSDVLTVLGRSGGRRKGDFVSCVEEPYVEPDGTTAHIFLVHGVRHVPARAAARLVLAELQPGDSLKLLPEPENPVNRDALLITSSEGVVLGWVPDGLLPYVGRLLGQPSVKVVRVNGPEQPDQLRLLIRVAGHLPPGEPALPGLPVGEGWQGQRLSAAAATV